MSVRRATVEMAQTPNRLLTLTADAMLVAYAEPGSKTHALAQSALAQGKPVYTVEHAANQELIDLGAQIYQTA